MKTFRELREKTLTPAEKKKREEIAKAMEKDNPDMPMDKKMAIATATAKRVAEEKLDEGRMKELHGYIDRGMTAQQIAKKMKLDVKTIKALMPKKESVEEARRGEKYDGDKIFGGKGTPEQRLQLLKLQGKALRALGGSPRQKAIKKDIDALRKKMGMKVNESLSPAQIDEDLVGNVLMGLNFVGFGAVFLTFVSAIGMELGVIKGSGSELKDAKNDIARLKKKIQKNKQYKLDKFDKERLNDALKVIRKAKPTAFEKLKTKLKDLVKKNKSMKESVNEIRQPLTVPKSLAKYVVYKKTGIGKIKQVAHLRAMPKGKELDRVLDKYDADGVIAMSKIKRNKMTVEAVDADDTGGEEEVNMAMKQVQAMRHFLDGIESRVKEQGDMEEWYQNKLTKANDYLKTLYSYGKGDKVQEAVSPAQQAAIAIAKKEKGEKPKEESRAYRDAMRGMKGNTKGMATTKKDKDIEATDDDRKAASKNIIMQLRKAADLPKGAEVEFERGKGKVTRDQAKSVLARFNSLPKPRDREQMQKSIKSLADIKKILGR